ncbi:MAG: hypothetical protein M1289_02480 [Patescibacteria group bacterium]|nr:hypothetical protein [Patescibacteria group bacterium]
MILGPKKLLELVKTQKLVENLSERELTNPEGAGFDLRLGEVYKISGKAFLGVTERHTAGIELIAEYKKEVKSPAFAKASAGRQKSKVKNTAQNSKVKKTNPESKHLNAIIIKPGEFFLVKTIEKINLPLNLSAVILPRTTTFRSGLFLRTGAVAPGYSGELTFGLKNEGPINVEIEMGARFAHILFHEVKGRGSRYRGQWQGGRVTTTKKEKQV